MSQDNGQFLQDQVMQTLGLEKPEAAADLVRCLVREFTKLRTNNVFYRSDGSPIRDPHSYVRACTQDGTVKIVDRQHIQDALKFDTTVKDRESAGAGYSRDMESPAFAEWLNAL